MMNNFYFTSTGPEYLYNLQDKSCDPKIIKEKSYPHNSSKWNYIKAGQLYKHTPTGIIRRVVFADSNYVTLEDVTSYYSHCSIKDFKKFRIPYTPKEEKVSHSSNYTNTQDMINIKNIKGKLFQHIHTGEIRKVVYADDNYVTLSNMSCYYKRSEEHTSELPVTQ